VSQLVDDLHAMSGVWHDVLQGYHPDGSLMAVDEYGGVPGPYPYENLVYITFDGTHYRQTNVTFRGRPFHERGFSAEIREGVLCFGELGPRDPGHIGVSVGPGSIVFLPARIDDDAVHRFADPDYIRLLGADQRTRITTLYRGGGLVRTLRVAGTRIAATADRRIEWDPLVADGDVHAPISTTQVYAAPSPVRETR
jgi:hypothetical protein